MYSVIDVCEYIIYYSNKRNYSLSNLKLQKLLYFVQAYFLIKFNEPCFAEDIEAWDFGPVVPVAYHVYKRFGAGEIPYAFGSPTFDASEIYCAKIVGCPLLFKSLSIMSS